MRALERKINANILEEKFSQLLPESKIVDCKARPKVNGLEFDLLHSLFHSKMG